MKDYRLLIAVFLIGFGLWGDGAPSFINSVKDKIFKKSVEIVDTKPSDAIIEKSKKLSSLIKDSEDRLNLSIFNDEFSDRLSKYYEQNITSQQLVNLYTSSLKEHFKDTLDGKYEGAAEAIQELFVDCFGDLDHILTKEELDNFKQYLLGLSWNLSK